MAVAAPLRGTAHGQDDPCTREAVIASFATAASNGAVDEWLQGYLSGTCSPQVQAGAQALADAYATLEDQTTEPASVASDGMRYEGEYPVLNVTNALGLTEMLTVYDLKPTPDDLDTLCYTRCLVLKNSPGIYTAIWLNRLRQVTYDSAAGQYVAVLDSGEQFTGELYSVVVNEDGGGTADLTGVDQITVYSLPEDQTLDGVPATGATWTLHVTDPIEATYVGVPIFSYTYYSSAGYVVGGDDHTSKSTQFQIDVDGRFVSAEIDSLQSIALTGSDTVDITTPNGRTVSGEVQFVGHDSKGDHVAHTWSITLLQSDGVYLSFAPKTVLTLTKN